MAEVLSAVPDAQSYFAPSPLRRSSPSQTSLFSNSPRSYSPKSRPQPVEHNDIISHSLLSSGHSSPRVSRFDTPDDSSVSSTPASSLSLYTQSDDCDADVEDDEISFPSYDFQSEPSKEDYQEESVELDSSHVSGPPSSVTPDEHPTAEDDTAVRPEPSQHVDYLSHNWDEEDIAASWRHIVSKRKVYGERSRLENASWRTWAKSKHNLKTVSPETLNWLKDCDVTWLYGPLQTAPNRSYPSQSSEPASRLSKNNSFIAKKPILKKRSVSELMLQKSLSASSLVKQAAACVQAQQKAGSSLRAPRPGFVRACSDFVSSSSSSKPASRDATSSISSRSSSGLQTPDQGEKRHIRFDDKVEQCIAIDVKDGEYDEEEDNWPPQDDDSSDDDLVMMKASNKKKILSRNNSRSSFNGDTKIIEKLEPTTLKYRTDSPDVTQQTTVHSFGMYKSSKISPSPSQETLRPSNSSKNFLLPEDDDDDDMAWEPSSAFNNGGPLVSRQGGDLREAAGLRRTESGMFMPYEDDEGMDPGNGILGRVVETVNTARDIAHVIWNVGWRN
ncbi:hypothetical protein EJ05DRAFT_489501 [Pseudovirgaria hyperparasitica]|uniref:Nitrogen regulatory protein areA GATA-like domain-containing protein n=1 Tax=Pseudovirgaria hyperparasitica TaxID=470096 RepID=A0A6A6VVT0_9PEZI|nr:uncharacterized protein EJ05DRAFT_489501 [Pseudovirgaria hyperparasitica]KAF2754275.1 hypothetical protein EJ05DRAFT_489501 [Pseudovirgaria hyperparasitica]